ncbi:hypothetical protein GIB67_029573 [Kingdonia uniflora]|uniref:Uncharacterized protein n=1 Tax=Kingdonia uniflora TaxID=39325 RepID=A0A7J7LLM6_9MAGN|nr:hypothetical protein GIB67_029573 [Kingdonia uniflora]
MGNPIRAEFRNPSPLIGYDKPLIFDESPKEQACRLNRGTNEFIGSSRPLEFSPFQKCDSIVSCTMNVTAGESDGHRRRLNVDQTVVKVRKIWENFPEPVKSFPWFKTLENFVQVIFYLVCAVGKYLCIPLLTISSLSELSYCAHERKMVLIPVPLVTGIAIAGVLRDTILELSPHIKVRKSIVFLLC